MEAAGPMGQKFIVTLHSANTVFQKIRDFFFFFGILHPGGGFESTPVYGPFDIISFIYLKVSGFMEMWGGGGLSYVGDWVCREVRDRR